MKKILLFATILLSGLFSASAYHISIKLKGTAGQQFLLGYYYGDKQYIRDSAVADINGKIDFKGKGDLDGGIYIIASADKRLLFDFVVTEQELSMETDTLDYIEHMKVKGSPENEAFFAYSKFATSQGKKAAELDAKAKAAKDKGDTTEARKYREQVSSIETEMLAYRKRVIAEHPTFLVAKIFRMMTEIDLPPTPTLPNGQKDSLFTYNYYKDHYFDNFDFSDDRIVRTPVFHPKVENYMTKLVVQIPDSINKAADVLIEKALKNKEISKWCIYWITSHYETSQYMGMDAVFVHMAEKYYADKNITYWINDALRLQITDKAIMQKNTLIGTKVKNLILPDTSMKYQSLYDIKAKYTIVLFWDPHCGHCKEEVPKLIKVYNELNKDVKPGTEKKVEIYAIGSTTDYPEWRKYIYENKLTWLNVHDPNHESNYHRLYDISSTPVMYLLNREKKVVAKRISVEQVKDFIERGIE